MLGSVDRYLRLWNLRTGESRELRGHEGEVRYVLFSPDGNTLASAGWDETVRLWDLRTREVRVYRGHVGRVQRIAFSPDGKRLASAGQDGSVDLWPVGDAPNIPGDAEGLRRWLDAMTSATAGRGGAVASD